MLLQQQTGPAMGCRADTWEGEQYTRWDFSQCVCDDKGVKPDFVDL